MANTFNTRIQLKRDSLTNWNESTIVLKPGEVGVAYVEVATKDAKGNIIHVPTALLKVGENVEGSTKTFKELPFVSALAADVYAWAKKEGIEVIDEGEGEVVSDIAWDPTLNALVISRIDVITPAELATTLASYYTKTEIDGLFAAEVERANGYADAAKEAAITAAKTYTNEEIGKINKSMTDDYATKTYVNDAVADHKTETDAELANRYTKAETDAAIDADVLVETNRALKAEEDLGKRIDDVSAIADAAQTADEVATAINNKVTELNLPGTYEPIGAEARANAYTDEVKATILGENEKLVQTYDTLAEIGQWIETAGVDATELTTAIAKETKAREDADALINGKLDVETTVSAAIAAADAALHTTISQEIDDDVKTAIDAEVERANGAYDEKGAAAAAQAAAVADAASKYETIGTAQGIVDALKLSETYEPIGAETRATTTANAYTDQKFVDANLGQYTVDATLHTVAKTGKISDLEQDAGTYLILDGGTSTTVI